MLAVAAGSASIGAWAKARRCCFCFRFPARWSITRWAARKRKSARCSATRPRSPRCWMRRAANARCRWSSCARACGCSSSPARNFPWTAKLPKGRPPRRIQSHRRSHARGKEHRRHRAGGHDQFVGRGEVLVPRPAAESSLQKIITLIKEAQQRKAPAQQFTDKFSTYYTYGVLGLSLAMFFVWWLGFGLAPFARQAAEPQRVLSHDDAAGRVVAVRAGAFHSVGGAGGHRLGRAARHPVSRRRGGGKTGRRQRPWRWTKPARSPPANCAWKKSKASRRAAKTKSRSWRIRWNGFPPIRSPAPSRATANSRAGAGGAVRISNRSPARACARDATAAFVGSAGATGWRRGRTRRSLLACPRRTPGSPRSGWRRAICWGG